MCGPKSLLYVNEKKWSLLTQQECPQGPLLGIRLGMCEDRKRMGALLYLSQELLKSDKGAM